MRTKFRLLLFLVFSGLFLSFPLALFSSDIKDSPWVNLAYGDSYYSNIGLLVAYSSVQDPRITPSSHKISGLAKLTVYQVSIDDILNHLVHDKDYKQINSRIDYQKFTKISELDVDLQADLKDPKPISLPIPQSGTFFVRLSLGELADQSFIIRSTFASLAREAKDTLVVWNQSFATKRSLTEGKATLYNLKGQKSIIGTANIDADGIASLPLSQEADVILVESQNSVSLTPLNAQYLNDQYAWRPFYRNLNQKRFFLITDRPIYKPGDTVKFKAIVRDDDDARYSIPSGQVNVEASQGWGDNRTNIYKNSLNIDSNGFISGSFSLSKTAKTGEYTLAVNSSNGSANNNGWWNDNSGNSVYFKVENYRKPEYLLTAESKQIDVVRGDYVDITLKGEYYSGQPLANTDIRYKVYSQGYSYYESDYNYPDNGNHYYRGWYGQLIDEASITLDARGRANINFPTNNNDSGGKYQVLFVDFSYIDSSGNPASSGLNLLVRSGEYSLYRDGYSGYGSRPNEKIEIPFILKSNRIGLNLSQNIEFNITRKWWEKYQDPNSKYPQYKEQSEPMGKYNLNTDHSGKGVFAYTPPKEGSYELDTLVNDSRGNQIKKTFSLWVSNNYSWYAYPGQTSLLNIVPDKKSYHPGETALINIVSEIPDRDVFIAFERAYQDRYQVVRLSGKEKTIQTEIYSHDKPNIFLTAKSFNTSELDSDLKNILIDTDSQKIIYNLSTDKANYAPGDEVTVNITAKDLSGNPVETNFALWSVDKSIFALADKNYGDVFTNYWKERYDNTSQAHSLEGIMAYYSGAEMGGCFLTGTKITLADGKFKNIEDVKPGEQILTRISESSSKLVKTKVTATHQTTVSDYLVINGNLRVTTNHLIFINQNWRPARLAQIGDVLVDSSGNEIKISSIELIRGQVRVYNLTTDKYHTYFADNFWVHNQKGGAEARDSFADTAYWNASVNTDTNGMARVKFKLPDNLTTWVITALGASFDTKVGEGFTEIKVNKDLVVRPILPNVLHDNDTITVSAIVHNFTEIDSRVIANLKTDAGQITGADPLGFTVKANDFVQISWPLKVAEPKKSAKFEFTVKDSNNRQDTVIQNIEVRSLGYWQQFSEFKINQSVFDLYSPSLKFDKNKSSVEFSLSSTILGSLPSAMTYLVDYPYGCVEQTTSALLPKIITQKYPDIFAEAASRLTQSSSIADGLNRLSEMQNADGGWSWWSGKSDLFVSAYVFRLITEVQKLGIAVDESMYKSALNYLVSGFDKSGPEDKVLKAFALSFNQDKKLYRTVDQNLDSLSDDYLAMAVMANFQAGLNDPGINGLNLLIIRGQSTPTGLAWSAGSGSRFGSVEASTALAVQALLKSENHFPQAAKSINSLIQNRHHDYWSNTFATAQTILAITDYSRKLDEANTKLKYQIKLDDKILKSGNITGIQTTPISLSVDIDQIRPGSRLSVEKSGDGEIYSTLNQKWWIRDTSAPAASHGVVISKTLVNQKGSEYNLVPGDIVDVVLDVTFDSSAAYFDHAVIEDHLPSGLVPVNTHLLNEDQTQNNWTYKEYLDDGIIIPINFEDYFNRSFTYQARVINSGSFTLPPAFFTLMYQPETWSRSAFATIAVDTQVKINPLAKAESSVKQFTQINQSSNLWFRIVIIGLIGAAVAIAIYVKKRRNP